MWIWVLFLTAAAHAQQSPLTGCMYRGKYFDSRRAFAQYVAMGCYEYGPASRFLQKLESALCRSPSDASYPCIRLANGSSVAWDFPSDAVQTLVSASFRLQESTDKWEECCVQGLACYNNRSLGWKDQCPRTWDGWACWGSAPPHTVQQGVCPPYIYTSDTPSCQFHMSKQCNGSSGGFFGQWVQQTDYSTCSVVPLLKARNEFHVAVLGASILTSAPALLIFLSFRRLRVTRVILHRNLVAAIILRNIFMILTKTLVLLEALLSKGGPTRMSENGAGCRALAALEKLAANAVFVSMLLESAYLHRLIAMAMRGEPRMRFYYLGAALVAVVPVVAWAVVRAVAMDSHCWMVEAEDGGYQWINDVPRIAVLAINTLLMLDIVRVLLTKLKHVNTPKSVQVRYDASDTDSENRESVKFVWSQTNNATKREITRRTARATLLLVPLFGVNFFLTISRVQWASCEGEQAYYFVGYAMEGLQGLLVPLIYCYCNREVQTLLRKAYVRAKVRLLQWWDENWDPSEVLDRRVTLPTMVDDHRHNHLIALADQHIADHQRQQPDAPEAPKESVADVVWRTHNALVIPAYENAMADYRANWVANDAYDSVGVAHPVVGADAPDHHVYENCDEEHVYDKLQMLGCRSPRRPSRYVSIKSPKDESPQRSRSVDELYEDVDSAPNKAPDFKEEAERGDPPESADAQQGQQEKELSVRIESKGSLLNLNLKHFEFSDI